MIYPIADFWSLMAPHLGFGNNPRPAIIEFSMVNAEEKSYVWEDGDRSVTGFPGTQGDIPDWLTNFDIKPNGDGIHEGFAEAALDLISDDYCDYLRGAIAEGKRIEMCGMSQGAAYACVVPWYLHRLHHITVSEIIHYGGPPWALSHITEGMDFWVPITRVVTPHDPVPCSWLPLRREGVRIEIPGCAGAETWGLGVLDHRPEVYTAGIRAYCLARGDAAGVDAMDRLNGQAGVV